MKFNLGLCCLLAVFNPCAAEDLLISGGPIYTGDAKQPRVEALLIRGEKIVFAGALEQARRQAANARPINLDGGAAYPGFVDSHAHLTGIGLRELELNLEGVTSIEALATALKEWAKAHPGADPITGRGWIETHWPEKRFPTRADIDRAVSDRPVFLERADGHAAIANSRALALGGVDAKSVDPAGGKILRDTAGAPTGMLIDAAMDRVYSKLPALTFERRREALERAVALYAARGWTAVHNMSATREEVSILEDLARARKLPIRVYNYLDVQYADEVLAKGPRRDSTGLVHVRGVKLYMDGALGSRGAALLANYSDAPGNGLLLTQPEELARILKRARATNTQVATHAIGDRGNRLVLDAYANTFGTDREALKRARWRIEHAQIIDPADIPRFGALGVIASMQPSHAIGDLYFAPSRLGPDRLVGAYAWRMLLDSHAIIVAGSDAPVEKGDPLIEFYAATYRHDLGGRAGPDWHLEQAVSQSEALRMLTAAPAHAVFRDSELGTLEAGKLADLTIYSADIMTAEPAQLVKARTVMTVVGGTVSSHSRTIIEPAARPAG
jgi:predicted amidohydrolase YtcJ